MDSPVQAPPKFLLGATLLFWGAMTGNILPAMILVLLLEGANWIRFRWIFDDSACSRAWQLSMVIILISGVLIWLDGDRYTALPKLMVWLPILLLPLQFIQSFGVRNYVPLNSFSFFSKLHRERNRKLGLSESVIRFNFGNPYLIAILTASSLGEHAQHMLFLPGLVLAGGWLAFSKVRLRPFAIVILVFSAGLIALAGQIGMRKLYDWATNTSYDGGYPGTDPTINRTSIGSLGKIKQSPEMLWRLRPLDGQPSPRLLRMASYNFYQRTVWKNHIPEEISPEEAGFNDLSTLELTDGEPHFRMRKNMSRNDLLENLPAFRIRGAARSGTPLPLPGDTSTLRDLDLDGIEINPLGTVRIFPKKSIIDGTIRWRDDASPESPPWPKEDLEIPEVDQEAINQVVIDLGLRDIPTPAAKLGKLRQWFDQEFSYTRYLSMPRGFPRAGQPSPVTLFLTKGKRGHCEYFATAATLILRAAGIPARYSVGFAVMERDAKRNEFVIRGLHGHAWCRAWDETRDMWIDFDATPSGWITTETLDETKSHWIADTYQRIKEDFFLWRNRPNNRLGASIVMWFIGLAVLAFIGKRLWKSKMEVGTKRRLEKTLFPMAGTKTPLHDLEKISLRHLGPRPAGLTYARWMRGLSDHIISPQLMDEALGLHQQLRFDPQASPSQNENRLRDLTREFDTVLKRAKLKRSV
ncbi:MAG: transglutaminase domain-containing protein [Armatimonadetes bacterium]|nr:transglutaminase domain-containing protein [Akkermansiaceae bacterium]